MPDIVRSVCPLFADGAKIFRSIKTSSDNNILQDLDAVINWSTRWQLPFNETKCNSLYIGKKNHCQTYKMNGYTLEQVTEEKDLGIIIDNELKFLKHTAMAIKKANRILGLINKSLDTKSLLYYTNP